MAQETIHVNGPRRVEGSWAGQTRRQLPSKLEAGKTQNTILEGTVQGLQSSDPLLSALGDESSRKILTSAIECGKTVEEISAEQGLPLSTCYRRVRHFVDDGLMILETLVVTSAGKRYAIYRTSFSDVTIRFYPGEILLETTPNMEILEKLRTRRLSTNYPMQGQGSGVRGGAEACNPQPRQVIGQSV